jgi:DNA-binding CsgD family transcriptional regulator
LPVEYAETLLGYGGFLRRHGQPAAARRVLARAIDVAGAAQARWLAGLAHAELRVAGGRRRRPTARELTPQEARVAALAATGAGNAQIARQLSVSVSTVETHLERIYAKLGIHSRHELIALAARGGVPSRPGEVPVRPDPAGSGGQGLGELPGANGPGALSHWGQGPSDQLKRRTMARRAR